jgi:DNA modification methylase
MKASLSQSQLVLPLLACLESGPLRGHNAAERVAERIGLPQVVRDHAIRINGKKVNTWDRTVRFTQLRARQDGLTGRDERGRWLLTRRGKNTLSPATPGVIVRIYEDENALILWAEAEAVEGILTPGSISTICTSPPYPLEGQAKAYGGRTSSEYERWLIERAAAWREALTDDGSLFLNLGEVYIPSEPTLSLYNERILLALTEQLGYHLCGRWFWHNPQRLPAPAAWVTIQRCRLTSAIEPIYWLAKTPHPHANNRQVLREYSASMRRTLQAGTNAGTRPSGHVVREGAFTRDNGGSIPTNVITASNSERTPAYTDACERLNLPRHPAVYPDDVPRLALKMTTRPGNLVYNPFGGRLTTARVALELGCRVITNDVHRECLEGGLYRLGLAGEQTAAEVDDAEHALPLV